MNDNLAEQVKKIYSLYHEGTISPEVALDALEQAIAKDNETE
jgi:hypothetical protein